MRPVCEACSAALPADQPGAHICSFKCTFCALGAEGPLAGTCPNCAGILTPRPTRTGAALAKFPVSSITKRG